MYLTKKKKFSHELVLLDFKSLLQKIKLIADEFYKPDNNNNIEESNKISDKKIHHIKPKDTAVCITNWYSSSSEQTSYENALD